MKIEFEWDAAKAKENRRKHGVSFEFATQAFRDPLALDWVDDSDGHSEERTILFAMAEGIILVVVFTERHDRTRLISARRATRHEQDAYYRQNDA